MKKTFTFFVSLVFVYTGLAQPLQLEDTNLVTRERWRDTCFGLISKSTSLIPSGYLSDYSLVGFNQDLDGVGSNDTLKGYGDFFYYYNMLELSKVNGNGTLQLTDDLFVDAKRYQRDNASIPLLFLFQPYQKINPNALSNNLFSITGDSVRLMDVPNRPSSPYDNKELFMFTPIQTNIVQYGNISFSFPAAFWQIPGINSVSIDFGDGVGPRTIAKNATASVYYATEGYKIITATINTGGGNRTAKCRIKYSRPKYYLQPDATWNISADPVYTDENSYLGQAKSLKLTSICDAGTVFDRVNCDVGPGAQVRVVNGCDQVFDKPIIIVEGFDTDNTLDLDALFDRFGLFDFIQNMRSAGHDFVFVNFKNPLDYIENNAAVLQEVIYQVNETKVGNARGSVIGFSMGGLVARWALKDLEDRSIDHEMDHYFSYDAPHQGANMPLGLQYLFGELERDFSFLKWRNLGGSLIQPDFYQLALSAQSPAAKQMLVTKGNYNNGIFNWDPNLYTLDPVRAAFAERLVQKGYPQNLTCHGIAFGRGNNTANTKDAGNGSQFGNFGPGSRIFDGDIIWILVNVSSSAFAVQENGNDGLICRYRYSGFKVVKIFGIPVPIRTLRIRNFRYTSQYPYDDAPGGYETTQTQFVERYNPINGLAGHASNDGHRGHNFVPTVSALDLLNQGYSANTQWQSNNLFFNVDNSITNPGQIAGNGIVSTLSPFDDVLTYTSDCGTVTCFGISDIDGPDGDIFLDNITATDWNLFHNGFISNQASEYIERKIRNAAPGSGCPGICNNTSTITGSAFICTSENYQLADPNPVGLNIFWESENGTFEITAGQGTRQITATKLWDGFDFVRVTLTNSCGSTRVIRIPVTVGTPTPIVEEGGGQSICYDSFTDYYFVVTNPDPTAQYYKWGYEKWDGTIIPLTNMGSSTSPIVIFPQEGSYRVFAIAHNSCGDGAPGYFDLFVNPVWLPCDGFRSFTVSITPNPTHGDLMVTIIDKNSKVQPVDKNGKIQVTLYDYTSLPVKQWQFPNDQNQIKLDVSGIRKGQYVLQVRKGKQVQSKQITIN